MGKSKKKSKKDASATEGPKEPKKKETTPNEVPTGTKLPEQPENKKEKKEKKSKHKKKKKQKKSEVSSPAPSTPPSSKEDRDKTLEAGKKDTVVAGKVGESESPGMTGQVADHLVEDTANEADKPRVSPPEEPPPGATTTAAEGTTGFIKEEPPPAATTTAAEGTTGFIKEEPPNSVPPECPESTKQKPSTSEEKSTVEADASSVAGWATLGWATFQKSDSTSGLVESTSKLEAAGSSKTELQPNLKEKEADKQTRPVKVTKLERTSKSATKKQIDADHTEHDALEESLLEDEVTSELQTLSETDAANDEKKVVSTKKPDKRNMARLKILHIKDRTLPPKSEQVPPKSVAAAPPDKKAVEMRRKKRGESVASTESVQSADDRPSSPDDEREILLAILEVLRRDRTPEVDVKTAVPKSPTNIPSALPSESLEATRLPSSVVLHSQGPGYAEAYARACAPSQGALKQPISALPTEAPNQSGVEKPQQQFSFRSRPMQAFVGIHSQAGVPSTASRAIETRFTPVLAARMPLASEPPLDRTFSSVSLDDAFMARSFRGIPGTSNWEGYSYDSLRPTVSHTRREPVFRPFVVDGRTLLTSGQRPSVQPLRKATTADNLRGATQVQQGFQYGIPEERTRRDRVDTHLIRQDTQTKWPSDYSKPVYLVGTGHSSHGVIGGQNSRTFSAEYNEGSKTYSSILGMPKQEQIHVCNVIEPDETIIGTSQAPRRKIHFACGIGEGGTQWMSTSTVVEDIVPEVTMPEAYEAEICESPREANEIVKREPEVEDEIQCGSCGRPSLGRPSSEPRSARSVGELNRWPCNCDCCKAGFCVASEQLSRGTSAFGLGKKTLKKCLFIISDAEKEIEVRIPQDEDHICHTLPQLYTFDTGRDSVMRSPLLRDRSVLTTPPPLAKRVSAATQVYEECGGVVTPSVINAGILSPFKRLEEGIVSDAAIQASRPSELSLPPAVEEYGGIVGTPSVGHGILSHFTRLQESVVGDATLKPRSPSVRSRRLSWEESVHDALQQVDTGAELLHQTLDEVHPDIRNLIQVTRRKSDHGVVRSGQTSPVGCKSGTQGVTPDRVEPDIQRSLGSSVAPQSGGITPSEVEPWILQSVQRSGGVSYATPPHTGPAITPCSVQSYPPQPFFNITSSPAATGIPRSVQTTPGLHLSHMTPGQITPPMSEQAWGPEVNVPSSKHQLEQDISIGQPPQGPGAGQQYLLEAQYLQALRPVYPVLTPEYHYLPSAPAVSPAAVPVVAVTGTQKAVETKPNVPREPQHERFNLERSASLFPETGLVLVIVALSLIWIVYLLVSSSVGQSRQGARKMFSDWISYFKGAVTDSGNATTEHNTYFVDHQRTTATPAKESEGKLTTAVLVGTKASMSSTFLASVVATQASTSAPPSSTLLVRPSTPLTMPSSLSSTTLLTLLTTPPTSTVSSVDAFDSFWTASVGIFDSLWASSSATRFLPSWWFASTPLSTSPSHVPQPGLLFHPRRPTSSTTAYICETEFCLRETFFLNRTLGKDPCDNFYEYACKNVIERWQPGLGSTISTDTLLVEDLEDRALKFLTDPTRRDMQLVREILEDCTTSEPSKKDAEVMSIISAYTPSGTWPMRREKIATQDIWLMAGRILKDFGINALVKATFHSRPTGKLLVIDSADVIYMEKDNDQILHTVKQATDDFLTRAHSSADEESIAQNIVDVALALGTAGPRKREPRLLNASKVHHGVILLLKTVCKVPSIIMLESRDVLVSVTRTVDRYSSAVIDYLAFRILLYFAPFLGIPALIDLFPLTLSTTPTDPERLCSRLLEHVFPITYMRALSLALGQLALIHTWTSQVESHFLAYLPTLAWLTGVRGGKWEALLAKHRLQKTLKLAHFFPLRASSDKTWRAHAKRLRTSLLKVPSTLDRVRTAARIVAKESYIGSALAVEVEYFARRRFMHVPVGIWNMSVPPNSTHSAFHMARYAVRIYRSLLRVLRPNGNFDDTPLYSHASNQRLRFLYRCLEDDIRAMPQQLRSGLDLRIQGNVLLEQAVAVILAHRAFQHLLTTKRIWGIDFRLKGLERLSSDQLFFVYFALDNCERTDETSWRRSALPPAQLRVNAALRQNKLFARAFGCKFGKAMKAHRHCPLVS
ncbi:uncharacterized protein LOC135386255 [Ornithodoros turicata]|uniref:uncharacterized protein LOC135386255 n=1 Tax=Ornithodoros turicata TaxID=34597 RepID=UPI0031393437